MKLHCWNAFLVAWACRRFGRGKGAGIGATGDGAGPRAAAIHAGPGTADINARKGTAGARSGERRLDLFDQRNRHTGEAGRFRSRSRQPVRRGADPARAARWLRRSWERPCRFRRGERTRASTACSARRHLAHHPNPRHSPARRG